MIEGCPISADNGIFILPSPTKDGEKEYRIAYASAIDNIDFVGPGYDNLAYEKDIFGKSKVYKTLNKAWNAASELEKQYENKSDFFYLEYGVCLLPERDHPFPSKNMSYKHEHKQVEVEMIGDVISVDEGIADIIKECSRLKILTCNSCQENKPGIAWIQFFSVKDACLFTDIVAKIFPENKEKPWTTIYGRVFGFGSKNDWQFDLNIDDFGRTEEIIGDEVVIKRIEDAETHFYVSIRFPIKDIPKIVKRLRSCRRELA